jgi:integrase
MTMPKYLEKRRRQWYATLDIPEALRKTFGKRRFIQSLKTDSLSIAEESVYSVVAGWKKQIASARSSGTGDKFLDTITKVRLDAHRLSQKGVSEQDIKRAHEDVAMDVALGEKNDYSGDHTLFEAVSLVNSGKILFAEHIDEFLESKNTEPKSKDMMRRDLGLFCKQFSFPEDVSRQKVIKWVNVTLDSDKKMAAGTKARIISACRVYWDWLEFHKGLMADPPFTRVLPPKPRKKSKSDTEKLRKDFRVRDYHKLLDGCPSDDTNLRHLITLGAYTGCRLEELCILKINNVDTDRLEILDSKSEAGLRTVPLHKDIIQLVASLVDTATGEFLLSGLSFNKYGDRSNAIGKRFGRLKTSLGYGPDYVFHSLRKSFATQLENASIPTNTAARLMGHDVKGETYGRYSAGLAFERLSDAISKVDWKRPEVDVPRAK